MGERSAGVSAQAPQANVVDIFYSMHVKAKALAEEHKKIMYQHAEDLGRKHGMTTHGVQKIFQGGAVFFGTLPEEQHSYALQGVQPLNMSMGPLPSELQSGGSTRTSAQTNNGKRHPPLEFPEVEQVWNRYYHSEETYKHIAEQMTISQQTVKNICESKRYTKWTCDFEKTSMPRANSMEGSGSVAHDARTSADART